MNDRASLWPRAREHFRRLCDLPEPERGVALGELAVEDAALAAYVAELIANDSQADDDLCAAVENLRDDFEESTAAPTERTAGSWHLETLIGRGGMGEVWRARRSDGGFEQVAALKLLKRGMDSEVLLDRFLQERRILARLEHPNIAHLLDGGMTASGRPFFAMELVDGQPINEFVKQHDLDVRTLLRLFLRICAAVDYAHRNMVIHRDLKPSNILVDSEGEPKLLDFGIAKMLVEDSGDSTVTVTQMRAMTPAYAAPEQVSGDPVTTATDVYALGLILYESITGALPAQRRNAADRDAQKTGEDITIRPSQALRRSGAEGPALRRAQRIAREVEGDLDAIVLTALRHESSRRYPSAAALATDIRNLLDGRPVSARGDSVGYRLRRFARRNRAGVVAGALVLSALVVGLMAAMWQARVASLALKRMEVEFVRAEREFQRAEAAKSFLIGLFDYANPSNAQADATRTVHDLLLSMEDSIATQLAEQPLVQAEMRLALASALRGFGELDAAFQLVQTAVAQLQSEAEVLPVLLALGLHSKSALLTQKGDLSAAEPLVLESIRILRSLPPTSENASRLRASRTTLALIYNSTGREPDALRLRRLDLEERSRELGETHPDLATSWYNLGIGHMQADDYPQALDALRRTEMIVAPDASRASLRYVYLWAALTIAHDALGNTDRARGYFMRAWKMTGEHFAAHQAANAFMNRLAAQMALGQGDIAAAEAPARKAWSLASGPDQTLIAHPLIAILLATGRAVEAGEVAEAVATFSASQRGEGHPLTAHMRCAVALSRCLVACDADLLEEMESNLEPLRGSQYRRHYAQALAWLAVALRSSDPVRAQKLDDEAEAILGSIFAADHQWARSLAGARWIGNVDPTGTVGTGQP